MDNPVLNAEVTAFLDAQAHPSGAHRKPAQSYLEWGTGLVENIKWNGPNYSLAGEDRITMRIHPPKQVQVVLHRGARQEQPKERLLADEGALLV